MLSKMLMETDPSIHQHELAACQLLSRFSPTNHTEVHFREESLEKSLESDCSHFQQALLNLVNPRNLVERGLLDFLGGWAGARRAAGRHAFRVWVGEFSKSQ